MVADASPNASPNVDTVGDIQLREPNKYHVIFMNDDATPMEWVVEVLIGIFKHSAESAEKIMIQIHTEGSGTVGIYTYEVAEQKAVEATTASRERGYPLQIKVEEE